MKNGISLENIVKELLRNDNFLLLCHTRPDADTLGSAFALCRALENTGKKSRVAADGEIPEKLLFLTGGVSRLTAPDIKDAEKYYVISVDVASDGMLGENKIFAPFCKISIDHHESHRKFAEKIYVRKDAAACGEIIYEIIRRIESRSDFSLFDEKIAELLYASIFSDTGGFRFSNTTKKTLRIAASLYDFDINPPKIANRLENEKNAAQMAAMKFAFENMKFADGGKITYIRANEEDKEKYGFGDAEGDDIIAVIRMPKNALASICIKKCDGKDEYKVSLRASADINVAAICEKYGGGGHAKAAGFNISPEKIDAAQNEIIAKLTELLE